VNVLVTGAFGQIGSALLPVLAQKEGVGVIVALAHEHVPADYAGIVEKGEVTNKSALDSIIQKHNIDTVFHMAGLLSASGEKDPASEWDVNVNGLRNVLDLAAQHKFRVFWPSSIAAFGPTTPRVAPQHTILEPTTMYGVTKVANEALCQYYFTKFGVDVRSLRYPRLLSVKEHVGGGTSDYALELFEYAVRGEKYTCYVREDTTIPMMYMDDAIRGTIELMDAPAEKLTVRTSYNFAAIRPSAGEIAREIQKSKPFEVNYAPDKKRQKILDSWPQAMDDTQARTDWGWKHAYDLPKITTVMLEKTAEKFQQEKPDLAV
jgi:nucleoside-diphosphate-sugar epimerase